jgi:hypothetical protein
MGKSWAGYLKRTQMTFKTNPNLASRDEQKGQKSGVAWIGVA